MAENFLPFDEAELQLLDGVMERLEGHPDSMALIRENLDRLVTLGRVVHSFPSLYDESVLAGRHRTLATLLEQMVRIGPLASPFRFPVKAKLARDFVIAKIQLFRSALLALRSHRVCDDGPLCSLLQLEIGESIYTVLIEDLLLEVLHDPEIEVELRQRAGEWLVRFWDDSTSVDIRDFCPLLESAWSARNHLVLSFGTLMGSVEIVQLMGKAIDPRFMDYFCRDNTSDDEQLAFEEFLFGLAHEQLQHLHAEMQRQDRSVVDSRWVAETLDVPEEELFSGIDDPEAMFLSYRKRRMAATSRRTRGASGPPRAAEMYMMLFLLERELATRS